MPFTSPLPDVAVPALPLHRVVLDGAAARGDHPALVDGRTGAVISYAGLAHMVDRLAAGLAAAGLRKGDVLALYSPNSVLYPVVFHAALTAGATVTPVNALATGKDLAGQLRDSGATWLVTTSAQVGRVAEAGSGTGVREVFLLDSAPGYRSVRQLMDCTDPAPRVEIDPDADLAALPYSSGTTGVAKGVMLTHRSLVANVTQVQAMLDLRPDDRVVAVLPLFHIYGLTVLMNLGLAAGATLVVLPRFELTEFLRVLAEERITRAFVAPPVVLALAKHPAVDDHDLSALRVVFSGAAPLDPELAEACARRLGCPVHQGYGMTEMSPVSHAVPFHEPDSPPGTIGKLAPNTQARVVDVATGGDVGPGATGELLVRGPQVMRGYLGRPEATDATVDADGWLHTGDLVSVDEAGDWYVVDRVKELIKYKGYQVPPAELEAVLLTHPGIADAAVVGGYDQDGEEIPHAFVVAAEGSLTPDEVIAHVAARVAPYKKVRLVTLVDRIPKSPSGKILRRELRALPS